MTKKFESYEEAINHLDEVDQSDFSQLSLARESDGWTVAHALAFSGKLKEKHMNPKVLRLATLNNNWTVAHVLASNKLLPEKFMTPEILKLSENKKGNTVAYILAMNGKLPEKAITKDILKLRRSVDGWTIAHELASLNILPKRFLTKEILTLAMGGGWTVAHQLATMGHLPEKYRTPEILLLKSDRSYVYEKLNKYMHLDLYSAKDNLDLYLIAMSKYHYPKVSFGVFNKTVEKYGLDKVKQLVKITGKRND